MSFTRGSLTTPSKVQIKPGGEAEIKCNHQRKAAFFTAGPSSKNPGRSFYCCPLGRDDPQKCKFFQWADEEKTPKGQTIGKSPAKWTTPTRIANIPKEPIDEIEWSAVDTDQLEREALSTPGNSQVSQVESFETLESMSKKRKMTPKRDPESNPFLSPTPISPAIQSLNDLSEHIHRQDRLLNAAEKMKEGFRKRIKDLQERNEVLEARVNELEGLLGL